MTIEEFGKKRPTVSDVRRLIQTELDDIDTSKEFDMGRKNAFEECLWFLEDVEEENT